METTSLYNLDDVFYVVSLTGKVTMWVVNNIMTSAVGHKIIYDLLKPDTGKTFSIEERKIETMFEKGELFKSIESLKTALNKKTEETIENIEKQKREFLKEKLNRTLNANQRKAENSISSIKEKISAPENEIPDDEISDDEYETEEEEEEKEINDKIYTDPYTEKGKKLKTYQLKEIYEMYNKIKKKENEYDTDELDDHTPF